MTVEELTKLNDEYNQSQRAYYEKFVVDGLKKVCEKLNIDFNTVEYKFSYESRTGYYHQPFFNGWSKDYVFVMGGYDGHEWIKEIPRNPIDYAYNEAIGGG